MGHAAHFNLAALRQQYGINYFIETGVGAGDSVRAALDCGFPHVFSIEILESICASAHNRFRGDPRVEIIHSTSLEGLKVLLGETIRSDNPILFWLDAHFPGLSYTTGDCFAEPDVDRRLPLETELALIQELRPDARDVFLIDDARIYVEGPFTSGGLPDWAQTLPPDRRNADFIHRILGPTHDVVIDYTHEGYFSAMPK